MRSIFWLREEQFEALILRQATASCIEVVPSKELVLICCWEYLAILAVEKFAVDQIYIHANHVFGVLSSENFAILRSGCF